MLTQAKVDELLAVVKLLDQATLVRFPVPGEIAQIPVRSEDGREAFLIDVNRKGRIKVSKCTYQERYQVVEILLRLDIDGPPHENPDGAEIPTPHLHIYKEGFADKWAYPLPPGTFSDTTDLVRTFLEFLKYCKVRDVPQIQRGVL